MTKRLRGRLSLLVAVVCALSGCARGTGAPPTRTVDVADTIHGHVVPDPHRWLEHQTNPEVLAWIGAQAAYADSIMGHTARRAALERRLGELMDVPDVGTPRKGGEWEYFTLRRRGEEVAAIYRRRAPARPQPVDPTGTYEKVVDPLARRPDGTTSVDIQAVSPDGRFLLYSVRDGGTDEVTLHVRDLPTGRDRPDSLPWALYASVSWDHERQGFYYVHRSRDVGPRLKYHALGTNVASDPMLFGDGYGPTAFLNVSVTDGGRRRLYTIGHGWARNEVVVEDTRAGGRTIAIAKDLPAHFTPQFVDGALWMRTDLDAPRGRVVRVDLAHPGPEDWTTVIPESEDVLESFTVIGDKVYVIYTRNAAHRIEVFSKDGTREGELAVPPFASVSLRGQGERSALLTIGTLAQPPATYRVDLRTGERTLWEPSDVPFDTAGIEVRQIWYSTGRGGRAPVYVMHRRGLPRDGGAPALLTGYGGFALSRLPRFDAQGAVWVEHGGVFASATLPGGNEFGEQWHREGMLANKPNVFSDFIAAAQALIDSGYTRPERLAISGTSNGGLLMGAVVNLRPDLFRVAYIGNPDLDILRFPWFTAANNAPALLEYGDASKPDQYDVIATFSPYQNVRRQRYPAMFITTGQLDTRVPPWAARKFAARVQAASTSGLPVLLYNDLRQGHAGGRGMSARIQLAAKALDFMLRMVGAVE